MKREPKKMNNREAECYADGFTFGITGEDRSFLGRNERGRYWFFRGEEVAVAVAEELGAKGLKRALDRRWDLVHEARESYQKHVKQCREAGMDISVKPEPCLRHACESIGICAATGRTCGLFRSYVNQTNSGMARVPDMTWEQSRQRWEDREQKQMWNPIMRERDA